MKPLSIAILALLLSTIPLPAQEQGRLALTLSISGSTNLGIYYAISDRLAIRPSLSFSYSSTEQDYSQVMGLDNQSDKELSVGADLLYTFGTLKGFSWYGGVGYGYGENTRESYYEPPQGGPSEGRTVIETSETTRIKGFIGGRYAIADFLSFFGEMGFERGSSTRRGSQSQYSAEWMGTRTSSVGMLLYFN